MSDLNHIRIAVAIARAERVQGLIRLMRKMGYLFALQVILVVVGVWIGRWPF